MTATPMQVLTRPFSVEPITSIMMPDGIFDNAIHEQRICCHFTNISSTPLTNVRLWIAIGLMRAGAIPLQMSAVLMIRPYSKPQD